MFPPFPYHPLPRCLSTLPLRDPLFYKTQSLPRTLPTFFPTFRRTHPLFPPGNLYFSNMFGLDHNTIKFLKFSTLFTDPPDTASLPSPSTGTRTTQQVSAGSSSPQTVTTLPRPTALAQDPPPVPAQTPGVSYPSSGSSIIFPGTGINRYFFLQRRSSTVIPELFG